ncbi:hypothetical protein QR98_0077370 [Sarcoptes scabiei]|uniref:Gamma-tubulin complex component n=1 Tax=Sarcoptes scabiei TaxID=52283 RepID=A0A132ADZ8_SARSC|nr:hypothetical protein QR98_0077370 [Sarcoptes scabiei]
MTQDSASRFYTFHTVEETFASIDQLKWKIIGLRESRSETIQLSPDHMEYFQAVEEDLDILKLLVRAIEYSLRLTESNHGPFEDLTTHYRDFRLECFRSHCARCGLIREIDVLERIQTNMFATIRFYQRAFQQTYTWLHTFLRFAERAFQRGLI